MSYKTLSSYPQEYFDTLEVFRTQAEFELPFPRKAAATNFRQRLYSFRAQLRRENPGLASQYEGLEFAIREKEGTFILVNQPADWKLAVRAAKGTAAAASSSPLPSEPEERSSINLDSTLDKLGFKL